jgi:hypothetical protein
MATFHGTLRLAAEPDAVHSATVILVDDRFVLRAAGAEIGDWPLPSLSFDYAGEDIRVRLDGDEALLSMPERGAFAAALGLSEAGHPTAEPAIVRPDPSFDAGETDAEPQRPEPSFDSGETDAEPQRPDPPATQEPEGADFGVGSGADQWATSQPFEAAPEPEFGAGTAPSFDPTSPSATSETPPAASSPWEDPTLRPAIPADAHVEPTTGAPTTEAPATETVPTPPPLAPTDLGPAAEPPTADDSPAPVHDASPAPQPASDGGETPQADHPDDAGQEPEDEPVTNDLPVDAAAAAAAVWDVRSSAGSGTDHPRSPADTGLDHDALVAARLASQRQSALVGGDDAEATDAAQPVAAEGPDPAAVALAPGRDDELPEADDGATEPSPDAADDQSDQGFDRLRAQSTAGYLDEETLRKWVAWGLLIGGVIIGIGAFLTWGDTRMFDTDFPVARALAALSALAAVVGFVLGFFMHRRTEGAYVAGTGAVLGLMTLFVYGRAAGIGTGFFVALLGVIVVAGLAVLAITPAGGSREKRSGR